MSIVLPVLAVAFAAFSVWLAVRIFNRREQWAKWTAAGLVLLTVYPLSFGPACWINERFGVGTTTISIVYRPIIALAADNSRARRAVLWYASVGTRRFPTIVNGNIEWVSADFSELIRLIESSLQPSTGELIDAVDDKDTAAGPGEL